VEKSASRSDLVRLGFLAAAALFPVAAANAADIPLATAVHFNTVCARCHEGECSGRLTFDLGHQAASNHMRRYAGEVTPEVQRDLYALLSYMKRSCAYLPLAVEAPRNGDWQAAALAPLRSPAGDAHFIPLGGQIPGNYRVALRFDGAAEACAQVISETFEITDHPGLRADGGAADFSFQVERKGAHYLRLQTGKPAALIEMLLTPLP
jgi:hypothetical protein